VRAMILAAGIGSRLDPLTSGLPKPMVPIANRPVMEHILNLLSDQGVDEVIINLHYLQDSIEEYFGDGSSLGMKLIYSREKKLMGTAGGLRRVGDFFNDTFIVIGGDDLTAMPVSKVVEHHRQNGALATIALSEVEDPSNFGIVVIDDDGRIERFQEKPEPEEAFSRLANTGIYVFEPEIMDYIPENEFYDFGRQVFPDLLKQGAPFYGLALKDYWCDVGTLRQYRDANYDVLGGRCPVNGYEGISGKTKVAEGAIISEPVILGPGTVVETGAFIGPDTVIGAGCRIASGAVISASVLWENCNIEAEARLDGCVLGRNCTVGRRAVIGSMAVLGDDCLVNAGNRVGPESRVAAGTVVK
jgi:mannose-1-phosphate guanylyltransferase